MGIWATVLYTLGMLDQLAALASSAHDERGLAIGLEQLPQRVRLARHSPKVTRGVHLEAPTPKGARKGGNRPSEPRR
jgi:hypothetical protein